MTAHLSKPAARFTDINPSRNRNQSAIISKHSLLRTTASPSSVQRPKYISMPAVFPQLVTFTPIH